MYTNQKFIFMSNENDTIIKALGKFISNSFIIREKIMTYFFDSWDQTTQCEIMCLQKTFLPSLKLSGYLHHRNA